MHDFLFLDKLTGISLGLLFGFIYVHYGWYARESAGSDIRKHVKLKAVSALIGQGGLFFGIAWVIPDVSTIARYTFATTVAFSFAILAFLFLLGFAGGFFSERRTGHRFNSGLAGSLVMFFQGYQLFRAELEGRETNVHEESKLALARLNNDMDEAIAVARAKLGSKEDFQPMFASAASFVLYSFFQHNKSLHPDFCASYYRLSPDKGQLELVASRSGSDVFRQEGQHMTLGRESLAFKACTGGGGILEYNVGNPGDLQPDPPLRKEIKRLLCVPVPPGDNFNDRRGVLCVDSTRDAWQFADLYHRDILKWFALKLAEMDGILLGEIGK